MSEWNLDLFLKLGLFIFLMMHESYNHSQCDSEGWDQRKTSWHKTDSGYLAKNNSSKYLVQFDIY